MPAQAWARMNVSLAMALAVILPLALPGSAGSGSSDPAECSGAQELPGSTRTTYALRQDPTGGVFFLQAWATGTAATPGYTTWAGGCVLWADVLVCMREQGSLPGCKEVNDLVRQQVGAYSAEVRNAVVETDTDVFFMTHDDVICTYNSLAVGVRFDGTPC